MFGPQLSDESLYELAVIDLLAGQHASEVTLLLSDCGVGLLSDQLLVIAVNWGSWSTSVIFLYSRVNQLFRTDLRLQ